MNARRLGSVLLLLLSALLASAQPNKPVPLIEKGVLENGPALAELNNGRRDRSMRVAYLDAFRILSTVNRCSEFYGGPAIAATVLNDLIGHIKYGYLPTKVAFQMSGEYTNVQDIATGANYRRFQSAVVNYSGSFFKRGISGQGPPMVGSFLPNTRQARALILMHEVGHLIQKNGHWLIPDDGNQWWQSQANNELIEQRCRAELKDL